MIKVEIPELGENVDEAEVLRILVSEGDQVDEEQLILELQTDKASTEMPSPAAGRVRAIRVSEGDTVTPGQVILELDPKGKSEGEEEAEPRAELEEQAQADADQSAEPEVPTQDEEKAEPGEDFDPEETAEEDREQDSPKLQEPPVPAGPATRRFAREAGVDLKQVATLSQGKRVTRDDVKAFLRQQDEEKPAPRRERLSPVRRKSAERLQEAWRQIPHVTHHDEADVTSLESERRRLREREPDLPLTVTALIAKAVTVALRDFPRFNASLDMDAGELVLHGSVDLGIAVDTEQGLLVPVLRGANRKTTRQLANEIETLAERARRQDLQADELAGSTFSLTNLGGIGGTSFAPIVNPPEVAIMGISQMRETRALPDNGSTSSRLLLPLSLSYDHRAIDGAAAARFSRRVIALLESTMALLVES